MTDTVKQGTVTTEPAEAFPGIPNLGTLDGVVTGLAELPPNAHVDTKGLATIMGRCTKSIRRAVRRGELPPPVRFMGKNVWLVSAILDYFRERQQQALKQYLKDILRKKEEIA